MFRRGPREACWILLGLILPFFGLRAEISLPDGVEMKREVLQTGGTLRMYSIAIPREFERHKRYPLIVAFHGYRGDVKTWFYEESAFAALVAKEGFIIAYPEGPVEWSPGKDSMDVLFFDDLVASLEKKYLIDPDRVYVIGHSNGAVFASYLLMVRPKTVAAAVAASGLFPSRPFPVGVTRSPLMVIWGEKDHMAAAGSDWVQLMIFGFKDKGISVQTVYIPDGGHPWPDAKRHIEEEVLAFLFAHHLETAGPAPK